MEEDLSLDQDKKSMDINPPGKGRVMLSSSRPVIHSELNDKKAVIDDYKDERYLTKSNKTINPINDTNEIESDNHTDNGHPQEASKDAMIHDSSYNENGTVSNYGISETNESAAVNELAKQALEKKKARKEKERAEKLQQELEQLTTSGEYHVQIKTPFDISKAFLLTLTAVLTIMIIIGMVFLFTR